MPITLRLDYLPEEATILRDFLRVTIEQMTPEDEAATAHLRRALTRTADRLSHECARAGLPSTHVYPSRRNP